MNQQRLGNLDVLRALAALAVCLHHFKRTEIISLGAFSPIISYGYLGVDVFFVISGFVIPLMLSKMKFKFADSASFLLARFLRLYPAYVSTGLLAIALLHLSSWTPGFRGHIPTFSIFDLVSNAFFICDFNDRKWIVPVFWTLAIEAQYYFAAALSYPLFMNDSKRVKYTALTAWIIAPLICGVGPTVFTWTALFSIGTLCYLKNNKLIGFWNFWLFFAAASISHALTKGSMSAVAGAATGLAIIYLPEIRSRLLIGIGSISYSFYLIHTLIGGRFLNLAVRLPDRFIIQAPALIVSIIVALIGSVIFFKLVEKPSHELSRKAKIRQKTIESNSPEQLVSPTINKL